MLVHTELCNLSSMQARMSVSSAKRSVVFEDGDKRHASVNRGSVDFIGMSVK
jgi:hypothetical protein